MSWTDRIKKLVKWDKGNQIAEKGKGVTYSDPFSLSSSNMVIGDGYQNIRSALTMDQSLMIRYADYENMDDYPELSCLSGNSLIFELSSGWVPIRDLAKKGGGFYVMSYDKESRSIIPALCSFVKVTHKKGHSKRMVRVTFDNGQSILCTDDHRFMKKNEEWIEARGLKSDDSLMSFKNNHIVFCVDDVENDDELYDLQVPSYENFVCNGVIVHNCALDIYADDTTITDNLRGKTIWAESKDTVIRDIIDDCLHRRIRIEEDIWLVVRTLCKYGDAYAEIITTDIGVVGLNPLPVPTMRRLVTMKGDLIGYIQDLNGRFNIEDLAIDDINKIKEQSKERGMIFFEPWEIVHWRLRSKFACSLYGFSILDASRWIWKRLAMLEDTALLYQLTRSPGRYAFYVDTGDLPPDEAMSLVRKVRRGYKKRTLVNPSSGELEFRNNPLCLTGDTKIPLLDGRILFLSDIVNEYEKGKKLWVYSCSISKGNKLMPMPISWAGKTRENAKLVKITLDNGKIIRCTPDHKFPTRKGEKISASDLCPGDSLMPFRRDKDKVTRFYNHKVVSVEYLDKREDTYTLTINGTHTFALDAGVFVFNSPEDDMWIPTRGGKESTRVDVLSGPSWESMDSIEYLRDKLFTSIKIPRSYYGGDASAEQGLAQKDVRFARTCMRVQREFRNGIRHVIRVHLAAINIDPDTVEWNTRMSMPSSIFELQQIEVMNAQSGLIETLSQFFPKEWLLKRILHLSEKDALSVVNDKTSEEEKALMDQARIASSIEQKYPGIDIGDATEGGQEDKNEGIIFSKEIKKIEEMVTRSIQESSKVIKRLEEMNLSSKRDIRKIDNGVKYIRRVK